MTSSVYCSERRACRKSVLAVAQRENAELAIRSQCRRLAHCRPSSRPKRQIHCRGDIEAAVLMVALVAGILAAAVIAIAAQLETPERWNTIERPEKRQNRSRRNRAKIEWRVAHRCLFYVRQGREKIVVDIARRFQRRDETQMVQAIPASPAPIGTAAAQTAISRSGFLRYFRGARPSFWRGTCATGDASPPPL